MAEISAASTAYVSNPVSLVKPSWQALKLNFKTLLLSFFIPLGMIIAAALILLVAGGIMKQFSAVSIVASAALGLVGLVLLILMVPVLPLTLLKSARGEKIAFGDAYRQARPYLWRVIAVSILGGLAFLGGLILFVIPGFIFGAWFSLAAYVAIDENKDVIESMKRSKQLVTGHVWEIWGMQALPAIVGILNLIPFLGIILTTLFQVAYTPAPAVRYLQLKEFEGKPTQAHWANYVLALLFPVALGLTSGTNFLHNRAGNSNSSSYYQY